MFPDYKAVVFLQPSQQIQIKSLLYSRQYVEACNAGVPNLWYAYHWWFSSGTRDIFQKYKMNLFSRNPDKNFIILQLK